MNQPTIYFTLKELNPHNYPLSETIENNLNELIVRLSEIRQAYGKPMVVTSALRSQADQMRINPKAPKSHHVTGEAADIEDKDGALAKFVMANVEILKDIGLWCEDLNYTKGWVHFQIVPPKSGKRFFIP